MSSATLGTALQEDALVTTLEYFMAVRRAVLATLVAGPGIPGLCVKTFLLAGSVWSPGQSPDSWQVKG